MMMIVFYFGIGLAIGALIGHHLTEARQERQERQPGAEQEEAQDFLWAEYNVPAYLRRR